MSSNEIDSLKSDDSLISNGLPPESLHLEYKRERSKDSTKYLKTVVAFANGSGGKIIFGVDDKTREAIGVPADSVFAEIDALTSVICDGCEPTIRPDITIMPVNGKQLIEVKITSGVQVPYYIRSLGMTNGTFVRVAATTRVADIHELQEMILRGSSRSLDSTVMQGQELTLAEAEQSCRLLTEQARKIYEPDITQRVVRELTVNQLLSWGLLVKQDDKLLPTHGYNLLVGKPIQTVVSGIQCGVFKGINRHFIVNNQLFEGPLATQIEEAYSYILRMSRMGAQFEGVFRKDIPEFPMSTVRELLCNAVCHRSYFQSSFIQVALYDDRLEITSPGMLDPSLTIEDIRSGRSKMRNLGIARVMQYLGLFEGWGRGIPDMILDCQKYGLPDPTIESIANDFRVNIYRKDPILPVTGCSGSCNLSSCSGSSDLYSCPGSSSLDTCSGTCDDTDCSGSLSSSRVMGTTFFNTDLATDKQ